MPKLSGPFVDAVKSLTEDYNEEVYGKFIKEYGTHYISWAAMGSRLGIESELTD